MLSFLGNMKISKEGQHLRRRAFRCGGKVEESRGVMAAQDRISGGDRMRIDEPQSHSGFSEIHNSVPTKVDLQNSIFVPAKTAPQMRPGACNFIETASKII